MTAGPPYWNSLPAFFRTDQNIGRDRWKLLLSTPELRQQTTRDYYRLITGVDEVVGSLVAQLKKLDIDKNTLIVFMGDNGFLLGEHGLEGKWFGFEESIRVPLIISGGAMPKSLQGISSRQLALNIDIAPTLLSLAGIHPPDSMQGYDLLAVEQKKRPARRDFFYEHTYLGSPRLPKVEGVVTSDLKYMLYTEHGYEELYDLAKDPHETLNLAKHSSEKVRLEKLRKRYEELKRQVK
nr:sulfatase/phosphatase domain-containing protein [Dyadobacter sandarakinus]